MSSHQHTAVAEGGTPSHDHHDHHDHHGHHGHHGHHDHHDHHHHDASTGPTAKDLVHQLRHLGHTAIRSEVLGVDIKQSEYNELRSWWRKVAMYVTGLVFMLILMIIMNIMSLKSVFPLLYCWEANVYNKQKGKCSSVKRPGLNNFSAIDIAMRIEYPTFSNVANILLSMPYISEAHAKFLAICIANFRNLIDPFIWRGDSRIGPELLLASLPLSCSIADGCPVTDCKVRNLSGYPAGSTVEVTSIVCNLEGEKDTGWPPDWNPMGICGSPPAGPWTFWISSCLAQSVYGQTGIKWPAGWDGPCNISDVPAGYKEAYTSDYANPYVQLFPRTWQEFYTVPSVVEYYQFEGTDKTGTKLYAMFKNGLCGLDVLFAGDSPSDPQETFCYLFCGAMGPQTLTPQQSCASQSYKSAGMAAAGTFAMSAGLGMMITPAGFGLAGVSGVMGATGLSFYATFEEMNRECRAETNATSTPDQDTLDSAQYCMNYLNEFTSPLKRSPCQGAPEIAVDNVKCFN